ncbi:ras-related protein Rab-32-like [Lepeophtheirus salmonis]|uniref:ras-related protein Rab-32-like n=1 Tax=Lepeophtheirus salmonis TaxID=72036 RepID=UPI001AE453F0|nr:ras-related protein Rab-32-like [Lepeophtheirus salmonis]
MNNSSRNEHLFKILVIGDIGTGKTSYIKRYVKNMFSENYKATIGVDFAIKILSLDPNTIIRLQLWDIAGQERYGNMTRVYYRDSNAAMIVFDVTRQESFDAVLKWKRDLDSKVLIRGENIPVVLLANKCDISKSLIKNKEKMDQFCEENGFIEWFGISARTGLQINESAEFLVRNILENKKWKNETHTNTRLLGDIENEEKRTQSSCRC